MSVELTLLVWSTALLGLYVSTQALLYRMQHGVLYSATARDNEPEPNALTERGRKALRNFLETYAAFIALALATELSGRSDGLTQWGAHIWFWARLAYLPLYVFGVVYIRSLVWSVAGIGLGLMFLGILL